jgi:hypothetical protein
VEVKRLDVENRIKKINKRMKIIGIIGCSKSKSFLCFGLESTKAEIVDSLKIRYFLSLIR